MATIQKVKKQSQRKAPSVKGKRTISSSSAPRTGGNSKQRRRRRVRNISTGQSKVSRILRAKISEVEAGNKKYGAEAAQILSQTILPHECHLVRVRSGGPGALIKTAIARNFTTHEIDMSAVFDAASLAGRYLPAIVSADSTMSYVWGELASARKFPVVHFYDPYVLGIIPSPNKAASVTYDNVGWYNANYRLNTSVFAFKSLANNVTALTQEGFYSLEPLLMYPQTNITSSMTLGASHPAVDIGNHRFYWIDAHPSAPASILFTLSGATGIAATESLVVGALPFSDEDESTAPVSAAFSVLTTTATAILQITSSGFYRFLLSGLVTTGQPAGSTFTFNLKMSYSLTTSVGSRFIINYNLPTASTVTSLPLVQKVQVNGCSLLLSNPTVEMAKGGKVWATGATTTNPWYTYTSDVDKRVVSSSEPSHYDDSWSKGCYGFIKPMAGFQLRPVVETNRNGTSITRCYIADPSSNNQGTVLQGMNVYAIEPPVATPTAQMPYNPIVYLRYTVVYEYTTSSQMVTQATSSFTASHAANALELLADIPSFTENKFHIGNFFRNIADKVRSVIHTVSPYARTASKILQVIPHPELKEVGKVLGDVTEFVENI